MKTHTIRNKGKHNPLITFTPKFFSLVQEDIESFCLMWNWFTVKYKELTGIGISITHDQNQILEELLKNTKLVNIQDTYGYKLHQIFIRGFVNGNHDGLYEAFQTAHYYYWMLRQVTVSEGVSTDEDLCPQS